MLPTQFHSENAQNAIDSYFTYTRIVCDDDKGNTFDDLQYKNYIETVAKHRNEHRIYANWCLVDIDASNEDPKSHHLPIIMECKSIGPETKCFCGCRFKNHKTDQIGINNTPNPKITVPCENCKCKNFKYISNINGPNNPAKCICKHGPEFHQRLQNKKCSRFEYCGCTGYKPVYTCSCKNSALKHRTIFENRHQRVARNVKTDMGELKPNIHAPNYGSKIPVGVLYKGLGGLLGMQSMLTGQERHEMKQLQNGGPAPRQSSSGGHSSLIDLYKNLE